MSPLSSRPRRLLILALGTASLAAVVTAAVPGTQAHAAAARSGAPAAASPCKGKPETHIVRKSSGARKFFRCAAVRASGDTSTWRRSTGTIRA